MGMGKCKFKENGDVQESEYTKAFYTQTHTHLAILQRDYARVFSGADDVIIIVNPLYRSLSKTLDTVSFGGYTYTHTHK